MYTLLTLIESCMNSRPITPLSNDPNDLEPLTPGHFLIGAPLTAPLETHMLSLPDNRLSRWQLFQVRNKWKTASTISLQPGTLVILREDNLPPLYWQLGRRRHHQGRISEDREWNHKKRRLKRLRFSENTSESNLKNS
ncbi:hypothetical protein TcasGA2_TC002275 [Tribolium castaneum]|uniref:DUF5641 domain-containing protein n=1 Tax=Tribolium castaneum TaxID=7070 RepID=D7EHR9_TRICA|nr:hypothetical protein TcasGA2_TC002275 [Tribolium castaneum]